MSIQYPRTIENLIQHFSKLPGVGRKTAERYVFSLIKQSQAQIRLLVKDLTIISNNLKFCDKCLALSEKNICPICADDRRIDNLLCVVANFQDMISIENTSKYNGKYFILDGLISTMENIGPEKLNIKKLVKLINELIKKNKEMEVILALSPTMEGETTSLYLRRILNSPKVKISKLAQGLSTGVSLEYVDEATLSNALKYRNEMK